MERIISIDLGQQAYSVFVGNQQHAADGNPCTVVGYGLRPDRLEKRESDVAANVHCRSWPTGGEADYDVECYHGDKVIACCGHGLLATANYWMERTHVSQISLRMGTATIRAYQQRGLTWLGFPTMACQVASVPRWFGSLRSLLEFPDPIRYASAGDEQGYDIFEWPDNFPLNSLPRPGAGLADLSQRAMIFTAKQSADNVSDVHFRYFAPQYGVTEDAATGSAMRILVDYFSAEFETLTALQCSSEGGLLYGSVVTQGVEIGGICKKITGLF